MIGWNKPVPATMPNNGTTFYAEWETNSYTITFDANGGVGGWSREMEYGTEINAPTVTREGYTFNGWSPSVPATVPAGNTTYTAQWKVNQYTATFNANGGTGGTTKTQEYGTPLQPPAVTRTGHDFTGWLPVVPETMPAKNETYEAQWTAKRFNVECDANGGLGGALYVLKYGQPITAPEVTFENHDFLGWNPTVDSTVPDHDVRYVAQWKYRTVTVTWDLNGGDSASELSRQMHCGDEIGELPTATWSEHTLVCWAEDLDGLTPVSENTRVYNDTTYHAIWGSTGQFRLGLHSNYHKGFQGGIYQGLYPDFQSYSDDSSACIAVGLGDGDQYRGFAEENSYITSPETSISVNHNGHVWVPVPQDIESRTVTCNNVQVPRTYNGHYLFNGWYVGNDDSNAGNEDYYIRIDEEHPIGQDENGNPTQKIFYSDIMSRGGVVNGSITMWAQWKNSV